MVAMEVFSVLVLAGDGIGPEVTHEAVKVLRSVLTGAKVELTLIEKPFGGASIDAHHAPVTDETLQLAQRADAVLMGAVGGPKWDGLERSSRPETGLLKLRSTMEVYANLRPARLFPTLEGACPLKAERANNFDFLVVRELISGVYFGEPRGIETINDKRRGFNTMTYTEDEIRRIALFAFELATRRKKKLVSVDKANVLEVSQLWRQVVDQVHRGYSDVALTHMYVDNAAMQLVLNPSQFDVIVTSNLFGDVLSDEAGAITGSIGLLPSASIGANNALYEPIHGSAPDIAGKGYANPLAAILSVAMMLDYTLKRPDLAQRIFKAVEKTLQQGARTRDIAQPGEPTLSTSEMGNKVLENLEH